MNNFRSITVILGLVMCANGYAQLNESTNVENTLFRQLEKSTRPGEAPAYKDTLIPPPVLSYTNLPAQAKTTITPDPIPQARLTIKDKLNQLYKSYAKLGFGNYTNVLAEYYFNAERARDYDYGVHVKHFSSAGGINDVAHNGFSHDGIQMFGKKYWNKVYGKMSLGYERNQVHYYGYNPEDFPAFSDSAGFTKKDYRQVFNIPQIRFETGTFSSDTAHMRHQESLLYRPLFDRWGTQEHFVAGTFSGGKYRNNEYYSIDAYVDINAFSVKDTSGLTLFFTPPIYTYTSKHVNSIIKLNPSVNTNYKQLKLRVGLIIAANADNRSMRFHFYPDIDLSYSLFNNMFIPYMRIGGNLVRNNYYNLTRENPYVLNTSTPPNTNRKFDVSGGFKGSFGSHLSFNISAGYSVNENYVLFANDNLYSLQNRFSIITDKVDIARFGGQLMYRLKEKWHVLLTGNYYLYETSEQLEAWNKPDFDADLTFIYNLGNKLIARINTSVVGNRMAYAIDPDDDAVVWSGVNLKPYVDADLQFEYRYTTRFSVFANFNNIASQKYQRWYGYRVQAFNVLGGLTYSF